MSVICQNFVQNAWKKELCSNCFKSVSDHDLTDLANEDTEENQSRDFSPKFIPKVTKCFPLTSNNPHTTWKNLISEKNGKHNQPFKLENGFQGRLLTINKASTNEEKRVFKTNGFLTKSSSSDDILNERSKEKIQTTNGWHVNGNAKFNKNGIRNDLMQNGQKTTDCNMAEIRTQPKLVKSKSEDSLSRTLHSILKKTVSTPVSTGGRRSSNVGFIEEEPLVIGYGGRDFTPEELEWDMNTSDIENEKTWDSLDETEDDKAFSKITKQNTEYNADNSNLLKLNENKSDKSIVIGADENKSSKKESLVEKKMILNGDPSGKNGKNSSAQIENGNINQSKRSSNNWANLSQQSDEDSFRNGNQILPSSDRDKRNLSNDPIVKGDKESRVVSRGEATLAESEKVDQNSSKDTLPSVTPPRKSHSSHPVMFTDGKEEDANSPDEENKEDSAGQILQAINTSLTNRHKLNGEQKEAVASQKLELTSAVINETVEVKNSKQPVTSNSNLDTSNADESEYSDDESVENGPVMEPRASFLHGISVKSASKPPSAIYGPASDLFVSQGDSSTSTSSEDVSKPTISHSINVIVNGKRDLKQKNGKAEIGQNDVPQMKNNCVSDYKPKPKIPVKPLKQHNRVQSRSYNRTNSLENFASVRKNSDSSVASNGYYSISNTAEFSGERESISLVDHYAETNIYHEVDDSSDGNCNPREYKLAALAVELEQVRQSNGNNNTKRQAPAPPKIPEPPCEDPPTCLGEHIDSFTSYRGEVTRSTFSSSSSTASTSSQDTETGYASWNLNGTDTDDPSRSSKKPKSFLLTQYSKCKMLAKDGARKKFSLKKLLKMKKEDDAAAFDSNSPNPKAWKYGDHNDRPRAKLEILHPMDLKNKSVTVNPGFDTMHSGSLSSFASADEASLRNSVSSDYGSFYSDTLTPGQDSKMGDESAQMTQKDHEELSERQSSASLGSPTPSRISSGSQASTLTSGSSKNDGASPQRPPKPPPPPRAHSLLPGNKAINPDGTFKFPVNCNPVNTIESTVVQLKPQAPKRHCKPAFLSSETGIYDNTGYVQVNSEMDQASDTRNSLISIEGNSTVFDIGMPKTENHYLPKEEDSVSSITLNNNQYESEVPEPKQDYPSINVTVKAKPPEQYENTNKMATIIRSKPSPVTKAPGRPPPIYMKSQLNHIPKNPSPWKTLEESYSYLTQANRHLLVKLVNQSVKRRKSFWSKLNHMKFQWTDFEIDVDQPSDVFAFGEKIAYHATMPEFKDYSMTLVVTVQQQQTRLPDVEPKYPVLGQFTDYIPKELLDNNSDMELESIQATTLVLDNSTISTIECFSESLSQSLTEENEKEVCFIMLQVIHSLKSLQGQGVESIDSSVQNIILAKTKVDVFNTLVFLTDNCFEENDYLSESCKISLCQYVLMLLFQLLGVQTVEEFSLLSSVRFSSEMSRKVFEVIVSLLVEEKAMSLSQTKVLLECYLWDLTKIMEGPSDTDDFDNLLHRWMDMKRCDFIKTALNDSGVCEINTLSEYLTQFLVRASIRNIKEVLSFL